MLDLGSAVVLGLVLMGLVALARSLIYGSKQDRVVAITCLALGIVAVLLVGASDFAHENVVLDRPLDMLNFWSQVVVGVLLGGFASAAWTGVKAISRVGSTPGL